MKDENSDIKQAEVNISISLETVLDIDEQNHVIELKFQIDLEWYELRANYLNLKRTAALNVLNSKEVDQLWIPYLIFKVHCIDFVTL